MDVVALDVECGNIDVHRQTDFIDIHPRHRERAYMTEYVHFGVIILSFLIRQFGLVADHGLNKTA